jgi:hypothetical protein
LNRNELNGVNQVKKKGYDGVIEAIVNKWAMYHSKKCESPPIHDVGSHVEGHGKNCQA